MQTVTLPSGEQVPALGQGTWYLGEKSGSRAAEIAALRRGLDLGLTLIDTAEMYGEGRSEELVAEAITGRRDDVFLVSKVYPHNATRDGAVAACERSLRRLQTDRIDLYLLHWWEGEVPLAETLEAFTALERDGKIRHFGVSNLDLDTMQDFWAAPGGAGTATNQLLYNLARRGIEWDLLPWLRERAVPIMAYSPFDHGSLLRHRGLIDLAARHGMTPAQVALAWLLAQEGVIAIPKSGRVERVEENAAAMEKPLSAELLAELDTLLPPPSGPQPLDII